MSTISANRLLLLAACAVLPATAVAQTYPTKPVRIIVGFAPGGGTDLLARVIGQKLTEMWGQQCMVELKPGAAGAIGTEYAAKQPPDGYTFLLGNFGPVVANPLLQKVNYNVQKDFQPVTLITMGANILVVNVASPAKSTRELIALAKAQPGKLDYGSAGIGGFGHVSAVMFSLMTGTQMTHVPYRGAGPAMAGLLAGEVQLLFNDALASMSYIGAKTVRPIAVTTLKRAPFLPDLPTLDESGVKGFDNASWTAMAAPAGTPDEVIARLNREMTAVLAMPAIKEKIAAAGATIVGGTPEEFAVYLKAEIAKFGRIVREGNITVQ
jgi:tripartite-type tricarboxylate transporter receptor subunit TctC